MTLDAETAHWEMSQSAVEAEHWQGPADAAKRFQHDLTDIFLRRGKINLDRLEIGAESLITIPEVLRRYASALRPEHSYDAEALDEILEKIMESKSFGGLELAADSTPSPEQYVEIIFQAEAFLERANSRQRSRDFLRVSDTKPVGGANPMTLAQKIFLQHALGGVPAGGSSLQVGDVIRTGVDWVLASELSWNTMSRTWDALGEPGIWRNDRFWLAGDHVVHPSIMNEPKIKAYVEKSERAKRNFKMTEYQGMNYTILHTEFVRERAEPGMLCIGSDSHTCSAGAVGSLSIGLGGADVMMTLTLGETWFKVPESLSIELVGRPSFAISGKDIILHILGEMKRNTIAAERIVEFSGEGLQYLSIDARFAICNMCTEFGAITGLFVPDAITQDYLLHRRRRKANKIHSIYFKPDPDAHYADKRRIDLSVVEPTIARYPNPDDVVPISEAGMKLDGVFIGACTTTEEELVLAALILKVGLQKGIPMAKGKRHYVPGSLPIVEKLRQLGLLEIYEAAGFTRGPPGCSMCVGLTAEKASEGETWLSSQNRNFQNRMGKGSFGHITSAAVCAASSFSMTVTNPTALAAEIDTAFFNTYQGLNDPNLPQVTYSEPLAYQTQHPEVSALAVSSRGGGSEAQPDTLINSKIVCLPDFIDTDALAPGFALTTCKTEEDFGKHVLCFTHPDFREKVKGGQRVVVAGNAFGVGSSRESAVSALKGAGVKAIIARSFAFIFNRNQANHGLLGIAMEDDEFHAAAKEGEDITIDLSNRTIDVGDRKFSFHLSDIEYQLTQNKGVSESYKRYGKEIWSIMASEPASNTESATTHSEHGAGDVRLQW